MAELHQQCRSALEHGDVFCLQPMRAFIRVSLRSCTFTTFMSLLGELRQAFSHSHNGMQIEILRCHAVFCDAPRPRSREDPEKRHTGFPRLVCLAEKSESISRTLRSIHVSHIHQS